MSEALKRIEEKHGGYHWCATVSGIEWKALGNPPCDVVKLARALDEIQCQCAGHSDEFSRQVWQKAERVLREVAGEKP